MDESRQDYDNCRHQRYLLKLIANLVSGATSADLWINSGAHPRHSYTDQLHSESICRPFTMTYVTFRVICREFKIRLV